MKDLPGVFVLDVLDSAAALDRADSETRCVCEAGDYARLPLQRAGDGLVDLGRVLQVDHVNVALRGCDDQQLVLDVHAVHAFSRIQRSNWLGALEIPELDGLVPRACGDIIVAAGLEPAHTPNSFLMGFCLLRGDGAACWSLTHIDDVEVTGRIASCYARAILCKSVIYS